MTFLHYMRYKWHRVVISWGICVCIGELTQFWFGVVVMSLMILFIFPFIEERDP